MGLLPPLSHVGVIVLQVRKDGETILTEDYVEILSETFRMKQDRNCDRILDVDGSCIGFDLGPVSFSIEGSVKGVRVGRVMHDDPPDPHHDKPWSVFADANLSTWYRNEDSPLYKRDQEIERLKKEIERLEQELVESKPGG